MSSDAIMSTVVVSSDLSEYKLSSVLSGHDYGVRDVAYSPANNQVCTLEERGRVGIYKYESEHKSWSRIEGLEEKVHNSLAFVLECVEGGKMRGDRGRTAYPAGTFMSGGADKAARAFNAQNDFFTGLTEHGLSVNSITMDDHKHIVTGAWDGVVRVWDGDECVQKIGGHEHAVEVLGMSDGRIVSASANSAIHIIQHGRILFKVPKAHTHAIRKIVPHPLGFATVGNDGYLKVWDRDGNNLQSIAAHVTSEVKFVYGLTCLPSGELVTCGEDGTVRIFSTTGELKQTIQHPAPVRSVKCLPNGDILTACSDRFARIFTKDSARIASDSVISEFEQLIHLTTAQGMKQFDTSSLPDESALEQPGTKNGQVKVINVKGRGPIAYQWDETAPAWVEIGEALGQGGNSQSSQPKRSVDGVEYDFVTDVYISDEQKVPLGFNRDDDPEEVTERFCTLYQLPHDTRQQVLDHVRPLVDPVAVAARKQKEYEAKQQVVLKQIPSWLSGGMEIYASCNLQAMKQRIQQTNSEFGSDPLALQTAADLQGMEQLFQTLADQTTFHVANFSAAEATSLKKLLLWPSDKVLPVLDCLRVLMVHANANKTLGSDSEIQSHIFQHLSTDVHKILVLKLLSNWIAKRARSAAERNSPPSLPQDVEQFILQILQQVSQIPVTENENLATAFVMLMHNLIAWLGRLQLDIPQVYSKVIVSLLTLLGTKRNSKIHFYALLAIGSIAFIHPRSKEQLKLEFQDQLVKSVELGEASDNLALREVSADVRKLCGWESN